MRSHKQPASAYGSEQTNQVVAADAGGMTYATPHVQPPSRHGVMTPPGQAASAADSPSARDCAFIGLQNAYRPHGGLSRLNGLAARRHARPEAQDRDVVGLVEAGSVFGFQWHADFWVPLFQFDFSGTQVAAAPQRVVAELGETVDGWALATWFVEPSCSLDGRSPIECLDLHLPDVLEAARAARFMMRR
ncbi:hypothetical protein DBR42_17985 [Pelomonas sp. HMWF004]|nr:hypothetical protein DBR42_17985 [Pelomonas sp. HMWF004]